MSVVSCSTTSTTAYKVTADTTGTLVFQTGATPTTAMTLGTDQSVTFAGTPTYSGGTANGVAYLNGSKVLTTGSALVFDGTNFSTTGTIKGSTTIGVGNATPSTSGAGITFPATQSASSDANTLDDYEEGTFTPGIEFYTGSPSYTVQSGRYVKVGRMVQFWVNLAFTGSSGVTITNLTNLPFTVDSTGVYPTIAIGNFYYINLNSGGTVLGCYPQPGQNTMHFHCNGNNTDQLSPLTTSSSMNLRFEGAYLATT